MKSTYKTLLAKLNERVINYTTLKSVGEFATKLIENHAIDIKASAVMYGFGKLLKRFCLYEKVQFTNDLLQDAFPIIISEVDRALSGDRNMSKDTFKDLRGEYSDEQVSLVRVTCWNFIYDLVADAVRNVAWDNGVVSSDVEDATEEVFVDWED